MIKQKLLFYFQLCVCMGMLCAIPMQSKAGSQEKITISLKNSTLLEAFKQVEQKTDYKIAYVYDQVKDNGNVEVEVQNADINAVMKKILQKTKYGYQIFGKRIIIKVDPKKQKPQPKVAAPEKVEIKGTVYDETGQPMPFCNVYVENTTIGVVTDIDGNFSLKYDKKPFNLVFSSIGYKTQTKSINASSTIKVKMEVDGVDVEEVVVTGYQKIDRKMFTGSAARVTAEDTKVDGVADVSRMLEGKVAGVSVQNVSGSFGAAPKIRVRGASSIYGDTKPLWVVDGVVLEDVVDVSPDELSSGDAETLISSSVAGLNAEDIAEYQILKDASATALYGARAMNGVIVIRTKRGKSGKVSVSFSSETTIRQKPSYDDYDILNSKDQMSIFQELDRKGWLTYADMKTVAHGGVYYKMYDEISTYNTETGQFNLANTPEAKLDYLRYYEMANTDWFDLLFTNNIMQNNSFSVSGGSETSRFYVSASYITDGGWTIADNVDRYTLKMNGDFDLSEKLSLGIQSNISIRNQKAPGTFSRQNNVTNGEVSRDFDINPFSFALNTSRTITPYDRNGNLDYFKLNHADINILEEYKNNYLNIQLMDLSTQFNLKYQFNKHLDYRVDGAIRYVHNENVHKIKENSNVAGAYRAADDATIKMLNKFLYNDPDHPNQEKQVVLPYGGFYLQDNNKLRNYYFKHLLSYNKTFDGIHSVNVLLGQEYKSTVRENTYFNGYGYQYDKGGSVFTDYRIMKQLTEANFPYFGNYKSYNRHFAVFSNAGYSYQGKYIINGTLRIDGSNQLGKSRSARYLPTWNVSGKYNMTESDFMKDIPWLSYASVRGTYGLTAIMGPAPNSTVILYNDIAIRQFGHDKEPELKMSAVANDDLTWEKQYETNVGLDVGFLKNRVSLSTDVYFRKAFDLIAPIKTSAVGGMYWKLANYADMKSHGVEFSLNTVNIQKENFSWNTNVTFAYTHNEVTTLNNSPLLFDMVRHDGGPKQGYPVRSLFSIPFAGLNEQGLPTFYNKDGDVVVGDINFQSGNVDYLKYEGQIDPKITGGLSNVFKYKGLTLKVFTSYSFGNVVRLNPTYRAVHDDWRSVSKDMKNRWVLPGDEEKTNIPTIPSSRLYASTPRLGIAYSAYNYSDQCVAKGDFVRLKEVSLSYSIPKKITEKMGLSKLSVKGQATNPLLLYSDKKLNGQDPEFFGTGGVALPVSRQYTFTIRMTI
ncbi:SusC/RagA family TonB-linked outer membrane protein [Puteibacter caeruleilacunae]|nr:SusC/RagA family TonB-linked outer membrane protein [Puteibacter caeruleilacunae]